MAQPDTVDVEALYDQLPLGVLFLNTEGVIVRATQAMASILGVSALDLLDTPIHHWIPEDDALTSNAFTLLVQRRANVLYESQPVFLRHEINGEVCVHAKARRVVDNNRTLFGWQVSFESKQRCCGRRSMGMLDKDKMLLLAELLPTFFVILNRDLTIEMVSNYTKERLAMQPGSIRGFFWLELLPSQHRKPFLDFCDTVVEDGATRSIQGVILTPDGPVQVQWSIALLDHNGEPPCLVVVGYDVTSEVLQRQRLKRQVQALSTAAYAAADIMESEELLLQGRQITHHATPTRQR